MPVKKFYESIDCIKESRNGLMPRKSEKIRIYVCCRVQYSQYTDGM